MDDMDEVRTQLTIQRALQSQGHYLEAVDVNDFARVEQLSRLGRAAAVELGVDVAVDATRGRGGGVRARVTVVPSSVLSD